ncbi:hypothetical protein Acid345_4532 [Candidatus Koribacter versatilis Ellin345]|uniref:Uncharacterized protein n=2 Tax=Candidatus Korobacter versatilis TaxID=658062 RepID=Q1IHW8_KORVE|nr:hypothetical protein Acid345_4532 [Candidatus Koribacter versatilis Ellin345]
MAELGRTTTLPPPEIPLMDSRTTNLKLKYRIEERPGVGWAAISDDPGMETIEAASKVELFEKLREKTAALIGSQLPTSLDGLDAEQQDGRADRNVVVSIDSKRRSGVETDPQYIAGNDPTPLASQGTGSNIWKILFFLLLALVIGWVLLHR